MIRWKVTNLSRESVIVPYCRYKRKYKKGLTVHAKSNSLGLMTFKRKKDAIKFASALFKNTLILKIQSIGRGRVPKGISMFVDERELDHFYSNLPYTHYCPPPPSGTICYKLIKVLT